MSEQDAEDIDVIKIPRISQDAPGEMTYRRGYHQGFDEAVTLVAGGATLEELVSRQNEIGELRARDDGFPYQRED